MKCKICGHDNREALVDLITKVLFPPFGETKTEDKPSDKPNATGEGVPIEKMSAVDYRSVWEHCPTCGGGGTYEQKSYCPYCKETVQASCGTAPFDFEKEESQDKRIAKLEREGGAYDSRTRAHSADIARLTCDTAQLRKELHAKKFDGKKKSRKI